MLWCAFLVFLVQLMFFDGYVNEKMFWKSESLDPKITTDFSQSL